MIEFRNNSIKLQIWDSAGQERYKALIPSYVRGAGIIFLIYDVSERKSFLNLEEWINFLKQINTDESLLVLWGNKIDLERKIAYQEGYELAKKNNMMFFETSAKNNKDIGLMIFSAVAYLPFFSQFPIDKQSLIQELISTNCKDKNMIVENNKEPTVNDDNNPGNINIIIKKKKSHCPC